MARDVACSTRVAVIEPYSSHLLPPFDNHIGDTRFAQLDSCTQSRNARANYQRGEAGGRRSIAMQFFQRGRHKQVVADHRRIVGGHLLTQRNTHHFDEHVIGWHCQHRRLPAKPVLQGNARCLPDLVLHRVRESAAVIVFQAAGAAGHIAAFDPAPLTRQLDEHTGKGRQVRVSKRCIQPVQI